MSDAITVLQTHLLEMFSDNSGDFAVRVEDACNPQTFKIWSELIRKRSPVFEAMIANDFKESREKAVTLLGFKCDEVKPFLQFLYTGSVQLNAEIVAGVASLADMYQVPSLEIQCSSWLEAELDVHTVAAIYKSALCHKNMTKVTEDCLLFIDVNAPKACPNLHILTDEQISGILIRLSLCITDQDLADTLVKWAEEGHRNPESVQSLFTKHVNLDMIDDDWRRRLLGPRLKKAQLGELGQQAVHVAARAVHTEGVLQAFASERDALAKRTNNDKLQLVGHWVTPIASNPSFFSSVDLLDAVARGSPHQAVTLEEGDSIKFFVCRQHVRPRAFSVGVLPGRVAYYGLADQTGRDKYPMEISASDDGATWTTLVQDTAKCTPMKMDGYNVCVFGCRTSNAFQWFKVEALKSVPLYSFDIDGVILPS